MSLDSILNQIESVEFDAQMNIYSGFSSFHRALAEHELIAALFTELSDSPQTQQQVVSRLMALINADFDKQYAHPHDTAIAAYLYVLNKAAPDAISDVWEPLSNQPSLWWTRRLAQHQLTTQQV